MSDCTAKALDAALDGVRTAWQNRDSDRVETAINDWPTTNAVVEKSRYEHVVTIRQALIAAEDRGDVARAVSKPSLTGRGDVWTWRPTEADSDD